MREHIVILAFTITSLTGYGQNFAKRLDSLRAAGQIPELAFAVVCADSIIAMQVFGNHSIQRTGQKDTASLHDYFHLGSNTKAITGFLAAYLVEQGKLSWKTKFFELFPSWRNKSNAAYFGVTLENLLSHRAGIQPYTSGSEYRKLPQFKGSKSEQRRQFARMLLKEKPVTDTSKLYHYSNAGYTLAALMMEKVTGKSWEQLIAGLMKELVHTNVRFGWPNKDDKNQPFGHWIVNGLLTPVSGDTKYNLKLGEPAGDLSMTLPAYSKFLQLNLQGLSGKSNLLKASTYQYLHFGMKEYAIGWSNYQDGAKWYLEHSGSAGTYFCHTLVDATKKVGYIVVTNSATEKAQEAIIQIVNLLQAQYGG